MEKYQCYDYGHDAQYDNDGHDDDDNDDDDDDDDDGKALKILKAGQV